MTSTRALYRRMAKLTKYLIANNQHALAEDLTEYVTITENALVALQNSCEHYEEQLKKKDDRR